MEYSNFWSSEIASGSRSELADEVIQLANLHERHDEEHEAADAPADDHERTATVAKDREAVGEDAIRDLARSQHGHQHMRQHNYSSLRFEIVEEERVDRAGSVP